ncbi:hypothetical protein TWF694_009642 [Orbilia ellipsospora]|uniref:Uncharacterized protein n=1 Tax=Orbilia ellipsospora TaxID=2528407 RepID=A0AAV9XBG6_9PEZI
MVRELAAGTIRRPRSWKWVGGVEPRHDCTIAKQEFPRNCLVRPPLDLRLYSLWIGQAKAERSMSGLKTTCARSFLPQAVSQPRSRMGPIISHFITGAQPLLSHRDLESENKTDVPVT